jgi:hypothetical protein
MHRILFAFLLAISLSNSAELKSNLTTTFEWLDGGSYSGYGTLQRRYTYPLYSRTFEAPASLFVDYDRHIISIQTDNNALGSEWIDSNGHWTVLPNGTCLVNRYDNYTIYLAGYRELVNVDKVFVCDADSNSLATCSRQKIYQGTVSTNCGTHACVGIRTDKNDKVVAHTFQQILYEPLYRAVTKRTDTLRITRFVPGKPALNKVTRPCACDRPLDYCNTFYPPGKVYHLCL